MTDAVAATAVRMACVIEGRFFSSQAHSFINESSSPQVRISKITIGLDMLHSRFSQILYLERGRIDHLASSIGKSHARAMAAVCLLPILVAMKTNASPIVPNKVPAYVQLQQQMHEALRKEHPEWVEPNGECPTCEAYESRLAELLGLPSPSEHRSAA
jgi:hypothetical protein